jgi:PKD repeat protein
LNLVDSVDRPDLAAESAFESALAVAPGGDATVFMALGRQNVSTAPAYRRFIEDQFDAALPGSGWQSPRLVDSPRSDSGPLTPVVAMESRHSALAAWMLPRASGTRASVQHFIWAPPVPAFSAAAFGLEVRFDARASLSRSTRSRVADFSWDFEGDGVFDLSVGSAQNTHAYARAGTYTVRLRVTDTEGISAETTQQISVTGTPGTHRLTLAKTGSGSGTVSSTPAGIACGEDCFEDYPPATAVTLNATPAAGSVFLAWSGCDTADGAQCTVTMHSLRTVSASFRSLAARLPLTVERNGAGSGSVASNPAGIACGTDCSEDYLEGTSVTLTAIPDQGSTFALWSSGCDSQNGNQCTVLVDRARGVAAGFALNPNYSNLNLTKTGAGAAAARVRSDFQGIDCSTTCSARFLNGGEIVLTPDAGSPPVQSWSGCDSVNGNQCRVNITGERSVSVSFAAGGPFLLSLDLTGTDDSRVDSSPAGIDCTTASGSDCTETYAAGSSITLRATPASGFLAWTGCDQVADGNFCQVTMNANRSVSARFSPPRLFVQLSGSGRVTGPGIDCGSTTSNCDEVFDTPITVTLVARPDAGSTFGGWIGCDTPNGNLCEVRVNVHSDNVGAVFSSPP